MKKPSAILTADLHLRETVPECRTDDFIQAQTNKLEFLCELQEKYNVPVFVAGDIFYHWKPSPWLLAYALRNLPDGIVAVAGQHDLPAHNIDNIDKSGIQVLVDAGKITLLKNDYFEETNIGSITGFPYGSKLGPISPLHDHCVALIHYLVYCSKVPFPGAETVGGSAKSVIKKMSGFDLIVSGDNHETFWQKYHGRLLVNPGSFMRTTAAQAEHKPCVFLWYTEENEVEQVFLPINKNAISREHIEVKEDRDERIQAFVNKLKLDIEIGLSFENNLKAYLVKNKIPKIIESLIWSIVDGH